MSDGLSAPRQTFHTSGLLGRCGTSLRHISPGRGGGFSVGLWVNEDGRMLSPYLLTAREVGPDGKRGK